MTKLIFAVFDSKAAFFGDTFMEMKENSAVRLFADAVNDPNPNNLWHKHPEDYSLYILGEYDNETGELIPCKPKNLITASALTKLKSTEEIIQ